jgi:hypothetical protein
MSKNSWRLVGWCFLVLSLLAVLSLAAADLSEINPPERQAQVDAGKNPQSKAEFKEGRVPGSVSRPQYLTKKSAETPRGLQSL